MLAYGAPNSVATFFPPMVVSTFVQFVNMPIVRATITIQNPTSKIDGVISALKDIHARKGVQGLWHGTSAGVLKTVPKYVTAVLVKDYMEQYMAPARKDHNGDPIHAEVGDDTQCLPPTTAQTMILMMLLPGGGGQHFNLQLMMKRGRILSFGSCVIRTEEDNCFARWSVASDAFHTPHWIQHDLSH
ncbi:unnamed protein product [Heterosigma akashiwo]